MIEFGRKSDLNSIVDPESPKISFSGLNFAPKISANQNVLGDYPKVLARIFEEKLSGAHLHRIRYRMTPISSVQDAHTKIDKKSQKVRKEINKGI